MTSTVPGGFQEQPHTADWALDVWAPDLIGLLQQAARGMYALMQARLQGEPRETYRFEIAVPDRETLLGFHGHRFSDATAY